MKTLVCAALALAAAVAPASAFTLETSVAPTAGVESVQVDFICGPGRHVGYEGRHCWNNRYAPVVGFAACPPGFHPGYLDRRCWPNR